MKVKVNLLKGLLWGTLAAFPMAGLSSCSTVFDDLSGCGTTVELRFVYDYNMEFANAFPNQVHCLSVYFFDQDGQLVTVERVTDRDLLSDEEWRLRPVLPEGDYRVVAYGGMDCDESSFFQAGAMPEGSHFSNLHVQMDNSCLVDDSRRRLHNHFYGAAEFTVDRKTDTRATVEMMRNTNSIQVALQNENGGQIDVNDFVFEIIDDNNDFDHENNLLTTGEITYNPWNTENRSTGLAEGSDGTDPSKEWHAALAQFTTSRLMLRHPQTKPTATTLVVTRVRDGETVFRIPLVNYMLMFKHDNTGAGLDGMGDQEYLDRENTWNFVFFLKDNLWLSTHIIINDWEVRLNNTDF